MGKKLYAGNLPYSINDDGLKELFQQYGTVESAKVIVDNFSGRSKGFGFVEMSNDDEAAKSIEKLNGFEYEGRALNVNEAKPKTENKGGYDRGGDRRNSW
ncbi:RNA-binding protein [bacterium]|nr:RNA-binding protein [bacterium]